MGTGNATATFLQSAGGGVTEDDLKTMCHAFKSACENFCAEENIDSRKRSASDDEKELYDRRGRFNDYFYRSLASRDSGLAGNIRREVAGVFRPGPIANAPWVHSTYLGTLRQVARGAGVASAGVTASERAAASYVKGVMTGSSGFGRTGANRFLDRAADGMRGATVGALQNSPHAGAVYTRWTDGTLPSGRVVEVKGPKDTPGKGQLPDAKKMGRGMDPVVVDCANCDMPEYENGCP